MRRSRERLAKLLCALALGACGDDAPLGGGGSTSSEAGGEGAGTGGGVIEPTCEPDKIGCLSYDDCCPGEDCLDLGSGVCGGQCDPRAACASRLDCCTSQFCVEGRCSDACAEYGDGCAYDPDCCEGSCQEGTCVNSDADNGEPCSTNADCSGGECTEGGWCTIETCSTDAECGSYNSLGMRLRCLAGQCAPLCNAHAACEPFALPGCAPYPDGNGGYESICSGKSAGPSQDIGDFCTFDAQCMSDWCVGWCMDDCVNDDECGVNEDGTVVYCVEEQGNRCFVSCTTDADCALYGRGFTCQPTGAGTDICFG